MQIVYYVSKIKLVNRDDLFSCLSRGLLMRYIKLPYPFID